MKKLIAAVLIVAGLATLAGCPRILVPRSKAVAVATPSATIEVLSSSREKLMS